MEINEGNREEIKEISDMKDDNCERDGRDRDDRADEGREETGDGDLEVGPNDDRGEDHDVHDDQLDDDVDHRDQGDDDDVAHDGVDGDDHGLRGDGDGGDGAHRGEDGDDEADDRQIGLAKSDLTSTGANPFAPENLRLRQDFSVDVEKHIVSIKVGKPDKQVFVRVHRNVDYRMAAGLIEFTEDRETYIVVPTLHGDLAAELKRVQIFTGITRAGDPFLWPVPLPATDGRVLEWHRSHLEIAELAMEKWVRLVANQGTGAYDAVVARGEIPEPTWPDLTFQQMLEIAFRDKLIDDPGHPVVKRLHGES